MKTKATLLLLPLPLFAATVPPPDSIETTDVPPIPAALREEVGRYLDFRSARFLGWKPDAREMLISTRFGEAAQLHEVKMPGGDRRQLTFASEPISGAAWRPKKGGFILYSQDSGGGEFYQLFRFDPATGRSVLLTDGKSRNSGPAWTRGGSRIAYTSTRRTGQDTDIYIMDPEKPDSDRLVLERVGGGWGIEEWSSDTKRLLLREYVSANESYLHEFDHEQGKIAELTPRSDKKVSYADAAYAADGQKLWVVNDSGGEFLQLAELDRAGGQRVLTGEIKWDVDEFRLTPDKKSIAVVTNEDGLGILRIFDAETGRVIQRPELPPGIPSGLRWRKDGKELGFTFTSARSPSDAYSYDLETRQLTRWTNSETGGMDAGKFVEPTVERFKSFDGLEISALVYRPDPARWPGPRPVLITIHGGPESQARAEFFGRYNFFLEELGVAIIEPNVRGSSGFGKTFLSLDNGFKREDSVRDIGALLDWIARTPELDAKRVAVSGGSYGGYMTLASLVHYSPRIRCGMDFVGISNFLTFLKNTQGYRRDLRRVEYGDERDPAMADFLKRISPTENVTKITSPLLIIQGANDPRVPVGEATQMAAALRNAGGTVWTIIAKDEGHGFAKKKNADWTFLAQIAFLKEHLLK